ncbi:Cation transporter [Metarhizium album ARSEF 1941]|uniref:Cation transporter n=1 Tax=Metarhizium album (strain ARSEF 1941) TaxID=1081103 RepID=A0A0B2WJA3_METAS|nr:Cation transporter [Metarhizium album ARSEF 1941]KHN93993.1 Cation transporter [Metarhizium album ARSEF 1941]
MRLGVRQDVKSVTACISTIAAVAWRRLARLGRQHVNFVSLHYAYFIVVSLLASVAFWLLSDPKLSVTYVDSLFMVVSGITGTGLNVVDLSRLTTAQQVLLCLLMVGGSAVWVSIWLISARQASFRRLLKVNGPSRPHLDSGQSRRSPCRGAHHNALDAAIHACEEKAAGDDDVGQARTEHKALQMLSLVVPLYFTLWQVLGCLGLGAWIATNQPGPALENGINPWWLGIFNGVSAFNNSGMSLLDANMVPFQAAYYVLLTMGLLILAGNTAYPIFLRFIFWSSLKVVSALPQGPLVNQWRSTTEYILRHPRRVYTTLFPTQHTWWLLFTILLLNSIDWAAFELLNLGNPIVSEISFGPRIMDGLFQAFAVRSGGFYVVPIEKTSIALQVLYVIMMYVSVYPVVITMRNSNVYEERSLGIFAIESDADQGGRVNSYGAPKSFKTRRMFISQQIRGQLANDMWLLALATFIITVIEEPHFTADPVSFSVFNIIFEIISAYGCVGISVGSPGANYSFCGSWRPGSKLVVCLVMLKGRHRMLPASLDYAVRLPDNQVPGDGERGGSRTAPAT